jgi:murein L,D-transpeptidase YcbB/YkuD
MRTILHICLISCILIACDHTTEPVPKTEPVKKIENINEHVAGLLKKILQNNAMVIDHDTLVATAQVKKLYSVFGLIPIWTNKGSLNPDGDTLFNVLKESYTYGLIPNNYYVNRIDSLLKTKGDTPGTIDAVKITDAELLLSDGLFKLAVHLNKGRLDPDSLWSEWKINKMDTDLVSLFTKAIHENKLHAAIDSLEPKFGQYKKLKLALSEFRKEFANSNWDSLPPIENDTATFYSLLKQRLIASHHYDTTLTASDERKLIKALKKFQLQHVLDDDGTVGKGTRMALNQSKENQIQQVEMNMERWRWEKNPGKRYLWVNIPSFMLKVIDADTIYTETKVIAGSPKHPTPLLKSSINYFIIYPYWNVPYKIASEEILPRIKWDTAYLRKNNFEVMDWNNTIVDPQKIHWKKYNKTNLPYKFRQAEGEDNSLGVIKFMFKNPFGVYLHDTNSKRLFRKQIRALSHGCVRMENPWILAEYLVTDDKLYNTDSLFTYYEKEQKKNIGVKKGLPIYIKYFTSEVDTNNTLLFYTDIYGKDRKMIKTLYK